MNDETIVGKYTIHTLVQRRMHWWQCFHAQYVLQLQWLWLCVHKVSTQCFQISLFTLSECIKVNISIRKLWNTHHPDAWISPDKFSGKPHKKKSLTTMQQLQELHCLHCPSERDSTYLWPNFSFWWSLEPVCYKLKIKTFKKFYRWFSHLNYSSLNCRPLHPKCC